MGKWSKHAIRGRIDEGTFVGFSAFFALAVFLTACRVDEFRAPDGDMTKITTSGWQTPHAADLGAVNESYVHFNPVAYLPAPTVDTDQSFRFHRLIAGKRQAAWVGAVAEGGVFRAYGRIYTAPQLSVASDQVPAGWAPIGRGYGLLDSGITSIDQVVLSVSADGSFLSTFMTGGGPTAASFQSAVFGPGEAWGYFTNSVSTTIPKSGGANLSDMAWNRSGSAYATFVSDSALSEAYVQRYSAFTGWDPGAGTLLGRQVVQTRILDDGIGVAALWRTSFTPQNQISLGHDHSCALNNGQVRCWGRSDSGQLGRPSSCTPAVFAAIPPVAKPLPEDVNCLGTYSMTQIAAGGSHSCGITSGGEVVCWGLNGQGQLGNGTIATSEIPVAVDLSGVLAGYTPRRIAAGTDFSCASFTDAGDTDSRVYCWGRNTAGVVGPALIIGDPYNTPQFVGSVAGVISSLTLGRGHGCASTATGMSCWGDNTYGQAGQSVSATAAFAAIDTLVYDFASSITKPLEVKAGAESTCMRVQKASGPPDIYVYCFGSNTHGQIGAGSGIIGYPGQVGPPAISPVPFAQYVVVPTGSIGLAVGDFHACVIASDKRVLCWGDDPTTPGNDQNDIPAYVSSAQGAEAISAGIHHTCYLDTTRQVRCWGQNAYGEMGDQVAVGLTSIIPQAVTQPFDCASGRCLFASWSLSAGGLGKRTLLAENVYSFDASADSDGNVVAVMLRENPSVAPASCNVNAPNCHVRVYSAIRTALGMWLTPSQVDSALTTTLTTLYQNSGVSGGVDYPTPSVAFAGSGKFLAAYPVIDVSSLAARTNTLYVRDYNVGAGWDSSAVQLENAILAGAQTNHYRYTNDVKLVSDGEGNALLTVHGVNASATDLTPAGRAFGYRFYRYASGTWIDAAVPQATSAWSVPGCPATNRACQTHMGESGIFPSGEAVVIFPAPESALSSRLRLFSTEFR